MCLTVLFFSQENMFTDGQLTVNNERVSPEYVIQQNDTICNIVHRYLFFTFKYTFFNLICMVLNLIVKLKAEVSGLASIRRGAFEICS